jgi:hypothetical protein
MTIEEAEAKLLEETRGLVKKWAASGLLDKKALEDTSSMAILLESNPQPIFEEYNERNPRQKAN